MRIVTMIAVVSALVQIVWAEGGTVSYAGFATARGETIPLKTGVALPADPRPSEKYAAEEWCRWAGEVTGRAFRGNAPTGKGAEKETSAKSGCNSVNCTGDPGVVLKRDDAIGEDAFRLQVEDGRLVISGGERGILYGVYEVLERFAGVRWYSADTTRVPKRAAIDVPANLSVVSKPDFLMRSVWWHDYIEDGDFAARRRNNANSNLTAKHGGLPYRFGKGVWACHTLGTLVPASEFYATHPEYFGEIGGIRSAGSQLCLTNPDVLKIVVARIKERIRADPGARFYGVSQDDHGNYCQCAKCAAVDAEEGSHAGCVVRFVNAVAAEVEKEFPGAIIETLAYQYSRFPTKKTRLRHNVVPCICSIECGFGPDPIASGTTDANRKFAEILRGWGRQTDELYVWDYTVNFHNYYHIFPNLNVLQPNLRFFRDCGVRYMFEQGDKFEPHAFLAELKGYLMSKWMWDADLPQDELVRDFTDGYYGAGGVWVRQFLKELDVYFSNYCLAHPGFAAGIFEDVERHVYSKAFVQRADELWRKAEAAAAGDAVAVRNVRAGRISIAFDLFMADPTTEHAVELDKLAKERGISMWAERSDRRRRFIAQIEAKLPGKRPWQVPGWNMIWYDDFDGDDSIDGVSWHVDPSQKGGASPRVAVRDGCLALRAPAKLDSVNRVTLMYGRIDVRAKLPKAQGVRAKVWTLGADIATQQWPWCGEIDIARGAGDGSARVVGGVQLSDKSSKAKDGWRESVATASADGDFHVYSVEWSKERLVFSVDGRVYREIRQADLTPNVREWPPFQQFHYMMLGVDADVGADPSAEMLVDWLRVYERE